MDNLVLVRVAAALDRELRGSVLATVTEEGPHRYRFVFEGPSARSLAAGVSLRPELPWIARPLGRGESTAKASSPFGTLCRRTLAGHVLLEIAKDPVDRVVSLRFADGHRVVAELATHGANLVLLDAASRILEAARHPRGAIGRLRAGAPFVARELPPGKIFATGADPGSIDLLIQESLERGEEPFEALRRGVFGLGTAAATLILEESRVLGESTGAVLARRVRAVIQGEIEPVIEGPSDPLAAAELAGFDPSAFRLLPWEPASPRPGTTYVQRGDAAATAGLYHEALERATSISDRLLGLRSILRSELRRTADAERRAEEDLDTHDDPERHRRFGEALLAGTTSARRSGDEAIVTDPYDANGALIAVPAPARLTLPAAAEVHFRWYRKAIRGKEAASRRARQMRERRIALEQLAARYESGGGSAEMESLSRAMRKEHIPVAFEAPTRAGRARTRIAIPRLEGVRLHTSKDGYEILVGRTGRDNDRLTFKLAGPDDFWFHARGVAGAHVVVRNPTRGPRLPGATLAEAASLAAWFSDARKEGFVDVQWTRRKNVRRLRGAPPGTVTLKRSETVRVRPMAPREPEATDS